jgi:hypothetical protein
MNNSNFGWMEWSKDEERAFYEGLEKRKLEREREAERREKEAREAERRKKEARERKERQRKARTLLNRKRPYTLVEGGMQYDYGSITAVSLAVWSRGQITKGIKPIMKDFLAQLEDGDVWDDLIIQKYKTNILPFSLMRRA